MHGPVKSQDCNRKKICDTLLQEKNRGGICFRLKYGRSARTAEKAGRLQIREEKMEYTDTSEITEYLKQNGFSTRHLLDAWKEDRSIYYITGISGIPGTQTMIQVEPQCRRYRNKGMRPGSVWTDWVPVIS